MKKEYTSPTIEVVDVETTRCLASSTANTGFGFGEIDIMRGDNYRDLNDFLNSDLE